MHFLQWFATMFAAKHTLKI